MTGGLHDKRRSSTAMARMPPCNGRLAPYPHVRVPPSVTYASSDSTLADSCYPGSPSSHASPTSSRNYPPPYPDDGAPPSYQEETCAGGKSRRQPLPKKTLIIRLFTSIFIAVIVCLIVAAVVGRIHDTSEVKGKQMEDGQQTDNVKNGTRITMMPEMHADASAATPVSAATTTPTQDTTHISETQIPQNEQVKIARPPTSEIASYNCPYIHAAKGEKRAAATASASDQQICGLLEPLDKDAKAESAAEGSVLSVSLHSLDDCVIARETYLGSHNEILYRCALSCSAGGSGSDDEAISGLQDGWKWPCN